MLNSRDYLREIQKFTTSQYLATGVRITAGVMLPTLVLANFGWLTFGMPFLLGALFVSITDSPGPIHHRRNGLLTAVALNTLTVFITAVIREHQILLLVTVVVFSFFYSLIGVFGNRAGAIGVLALVIMLLNLTPRQESNLLRDALLVFSGGMWYTGFSLLLYSIRPYRVAQQAVGENIIAVASYLRARASLYKEGSDIPSGFNKVMNEQSAVLKIQDQAREILFKTRQFIGDASPKSRSLMMIFIESIDLLEQTMAAYQDYELLHRTLRNTGLLNKFYGIILQISAELEHIGLLVQSGEAIRKDITFTSSLGELVDALGAARTNVSDQSISASIAAMEKGLDNLHRIAALMQRLVQYTRLEIDVKSYSSLVEVNTVAMTHPIRWQEIRENLTLKSNTFRHALRLTVAMVVGYGLSYYFNLSHAYWVLLTIVTILKPVYATSRKRNMQRVGGTLIGALLAIAIIYFITSIAALLVIMIFCMIMGYSLLRVNYFGFVLFMTLYIIITFHFLNPEEFRVLITDRLVDTVIGSVIAFIAARFILPVWGSEEIEGYMLQTLKTSEAYVNISWKSLANNTTESKEYKLARKDAVVALTNLSENFQRILAEPKQAQQSVQLHQFVIASHLLMGHIAALSNERFSKDIFSHRDVGKVLENISTEFKRAENKLKSHPDENAFGSGVQPVLWQVPVQLTTIYDLVHDINLIAGRMRVR
jgi:uncharacterized membrane protein YccC